MKKPLKTVLVGSHVTTDFRAKIQAYAKEKDVSVSAAIRDLLETGLVFERVCTERKVARIAIAYVGEVRS